MEIGFELGLPESSAAAFVLWDSLAYKCLFAGNEEKCSSCRGFQKKTDGCMKSTSPPAPTPPVIAGLARFRLESELCYSHLCHTQTPEDSKDGHGSG